MGVTLIALALQNGTWGFAALYLLFFLLVGVEGSPFAALFNSQVPSERRSTMLSMQSLVLQVGGLIGTLFLGYIAQTYSFGTAWTVAGLILVLSAVAYLELRRPGRKALICQMVHLVLHERRVHLCQFRKRLGNQQLINSEPFWRPYHRVCPWET